MLLPAVVRQTMHGSPLRKGRKYPDNARVQQNCLVAPRCSVVPQDRHSHHPRHPMASKPQHVLTDSTCQSPWIPNSMIGWYKNTHRKWEPTRGLVTTQEWTTSSTHTHTCLLSLPPRKAVKAAQLYCTGPCCCCVKGARHYNCYSRRASTRHAAHTAVTGTQHHCRCW